MQPTFYTVLKGILGVACVFTLVSCEVGPDYQSHDPSLPRDWLSQPTMPTGPSAPSAKATVDQKWWINFNDPLLNTLIDKAAANNLDLKVAEQRILEARARVGSATSSLLPSGDVKGSAVREANQVALPGGSANSFGPLLHKPFNIFDVGFDASWELDLFGGNRRNQEEAEAEMQASEATRDDVEVSLLAEVARTYVAIGLAKAQLVINQNIVSTDEKTLALAQERFDAGQSPRLDVTEAEAILEEARTQLPSTRNRIADAEYKMDVLLGEQPGATHQLLGNASSIPVSDQALVLAAPASVMAQRPDIRVAERNLAAATAQQGVALAKFFPNISLTGFFGALNTSTSNLLTGTNQSWLAGSSVIWPILSYGTLSANLDQANAQQKEALASYQKAILSALSDVERALNAYNEQEKYMQSLSNRVDKDMHARAIANERYQAGLTSLANVLDAERTLDAAKKDLAQARADDTDDLIAIYKSLGGGWISNRNNKG